jgi:hypothetical protein
MATDATDVTTPQNLGAALRQVRQGMRKVNQAANDCQRDDLNDGLVALRDAVDQALSHLA